MIAWTFNPPPPKKKQNKKNIRNTTNFQGNVIKRYSKKKNGLLDRQQKVFTL